MYSLDENLLSYPGLKKKLSVKLLTGMAAASTKVDIFGTFKVEKMKIKTTVFVFFLFT